MRCRSHLCKVVCLAAFHANNKWRGSHCPDGLLMVVSKWWFEFSGEITFPYPFKPRCNLLFASTLFSFALFKPLSGLGFTSILPVKPLFSPHFFLFGNHFLPQCHPCLLDAQTKLEPQRFQIAATQNRRAPAKLQPKSRLALWNRG